MSINQISHLVKPIRSSFVGSPALNVNRSALSSESWFARARSF